MRDRLRVLLVSGEPHAGERTWRNLLKSDPAVDLVHFTILRPPEKQDGTPIHELSLIAFPIRELFEVKLNEFDLIIFDRYRRRGVLPRAYFENIAHYVEDGGALLDAAGAGIRRRRSASTHRRSATSCRREPTGEVIEDGFRPQLTDVGQRHPVTAGLAGGGGDKPDLGPLVPPSSSATVKRGDTVMSGTDDEPLLVLDRVGKGRVAQLLTDQIWLWARGFEGGGPQAELLRRVAHWLMKEPELEEEDLRAIVIDGRLEITRRSLGEKPKTVEVTTPSRRQGHGAADGRRQRQARPARWRRRESGLYRVSDGAHRPSPRAAISIPLELADLRSTDDRLRAAGRGHRRRHRPPGRATACPTSAACEPGRDAAGRAGSACARTKTTSSPASTRLPLLPAILLLLLGLGTTVSPGGARGGRVPRLIPRRNRFVGATWVARPSASTHCETKDARA